MLNLKQLIAIVLLLSPLTFIGQAKSSHKTKGYDQPITRVKHNYSGKKAPNSYLYILAGAGPTILNGDNGNKFKLGIEGNFGLGWQIHPWVGIEGRLGFATVKGGYDDVKSQTVRALEVNGHLMLNLSNIIFGIDNSRKFDIVAHVGYGQVQHRGRVVYNNGGEDSYGWTNYTEHNTNLINGKIDGRWEPYGGGLNGRLVSETIPMGVLLSYKLNDRFKLDFDVTTTRVDTDRFDALPRGYHYDWYSTFNIRAQYRLKLRTKAPSPCDNLFSDYR